MYIESTKYFVKKLFFIGESESAIRKGLSFKIGPYFFEGRLAEQVYANFLQNVLPQLMEDVPLHVCMNMRMQHDGVPPHYALCSRQVINEIG